MYLKKITMDNCNELFLKATNSEMLRRNEPELRELNQQLHNKFVRKNQLCQMKEKEYRELQEEIRQKRDNRVLFEKYMEELKVQEETKRDNIKRKNIYGIELQNQIEIHKKYLDSDMQMKELERKEMEALAKQYEKENVKKIEEKEKKIDFFKKEVQLFKKTKEVENAKQKLLLLEEYKRIEKANKELEERLKKFENENKAKRESREKLKSQIAENLLAQKTAREERAKLIEELKEYEHLQAEKQRDKKSTWNKFERQESMRKILEKQIESNIAHEKHLLVLESKYTMQLLAEVQKQKEWDEYQETFSKTKQRNYYKEVEKQINVNSERRKQREDFVKETHNYIRHFNQTKEFQIAEEKKSMIQEFNQKFSP